jgi:hypothetical protein
MSGISNDLPGVNTPLPDDCHEPVTRIAAALAKTPRTKKNADERWYWREQLKLARYVARMERRLPPEATLRKRLAEASAWRDWRPHESYPTARDPITDQTWPVLGNEYGAPPPRLRTYRERKANELVIERLSVDLDLLAYRDACDDELRKACHFSAEDLGVLQ